MFGGLIDLFLGCFMIVASLFGKFKRKDGLFRYAKVILFCCGLYLTVTSVLNIIKSMG